MKHRFPSCTNVYTGMLQTFEIIWTLFTEILLNITMYDSFSPFSFSFCIQVQTVKTQMKYSIRWRYIRICTAICKDWKTLFYIFYIPLTIHIQNENETSVKIQRTNDVITDCSQSGFITIDCDNDFDFEAGKITNNSWIKFDI